MILKTIIISMLIVIWPCQAHYYIDDGQKIELTPIASAAHSRSLTPFNLYQKLNGQVVGVGNQLFVELKQTSNLNLFSTQYQLKIVRDIGKNTWLFKTSKGVLPLLEELYQDPQVINAYPDFLKKASKR